jgi:hypothetical protein
MARKIVQGLAFVGVVAGFGVLGAGCLDRPVTAQAPTIKTNFTAAVNQNGIDKVDLLFDIDNSASMGDKQAYFQAAIPQMVARLVTPRCIDDNSGDPTGQNASSTDGTCASGSTPEFTAVHDMHVGVVTSSLGPRLGDACTSTTDVTSAPSSGSVKAPPFNNDNGELINRSGAFGSGAALQDAVLPEGGGFLYWFPALGNTGKSAVNPPASITNAGAAGQAGTLIGDFTELVGAAGESGCGIESQLESWYRFLIQPDPYATLVNNNSQAVWSGVDTTIIQQRHDFLRPDSLVAVIVLSDENDSEIDIRSYRGTGYMFMQQSWDPPRGTTACETDPTNANCMTCGTSACSANASCSSDPNCKLGDFTSDSDWGYNLNLRHVHMPQKYALNPQFPMTRYYNGLTSMKVPNRLGEYPNSTSSYTGTNNCTNPLFASSLPQASDVPDSQSLTPAEIGTTLCNLPTGAVRTASDVFYADIGGVPHELLQSKPGDGTCDANTAAADCPQKDTLGQSDWKLILGEGPASYLPPSFPVSYDYDGIDPHMIESQVPRNTMPNPPASNPAVTTLSGPALGTGSDPLRPDPVNGREWTTNAGIHSNPVDVEFACIFQLPPSSQRDCSAIGGNTIEGNSCDCDPGNKDLTNPWTSGGPAAVTGNTPEEISPLCAKTSTDGKITSSIGDYTVQTYAKAYPTIRQLMLANMMGGQGIVSSLCPIHTEDNSAGDDPLYGYRPAVNAIVNRLKSALTAQCVPALTPQGNKVPCLVLVSFPTGVGPNQTPAMKCESYNNGQGYTTPLASVLQEFNAQQNAAAADGGTTTTNLAKDMTCALDQIAVTPGQNCNTGSLGAGWCYVTDSSSAASCPQEIAYSSVNIVPNGAVISLQCIAQSSGSGTGSGK